MVVTCAIQRLCVGTGFSIVYGALFTKTNRISRIFDSVFASFHFNIHRPFFNYYSFFGNAHKRLHALPNGPVSSAQNLKWSSLLASFHFRFIHFFFKWFLLFSILIAFFFFKWKMLGTVLWMWMEPPGIRAAYPQRDQTILKCRMEDSSFLLSQVFNVLLIAVCTVYAVKTRKIPENFNESKFIGFTM